MLVSADVLLPDGCIQIIKKEDFNYSKRSSAFKRGEKNGVVLCVKLKTEKVDNIDLQECHLLLLNSQETKKIIT